MNIHVVTTFSPRGYQVYGRRFIDSFLKHWTPNAHLYVFGENQIGVNAPERLTWNDLKDDPQHEEFCSTYAGPEYNHPRNANMMGVRFAHKVFAVTSDKLPKHGWRVWIDADVETVRPVTDAWLQVILPHNKALSYLGRKGMFRKNQPAYTECGFVGYNLGNAQVRTALAHMRDIYVTGELFKQGEHNWHDSYTFDRVRKEHVDPSLWHDLAAKAPKVTHVWPDTKLGETMLHMKGPRRKQFHYGRHA